MVISIVEWPSSSWTALSGTPRMARWDANVCRRTCQPTSRSPARLQARHSGALVPQLAVCGAEDELAAQVATGDDEAVIKPTVEALSNLPVEDIFRFDDLLAEK